jgi:GT2 family glycosyltransferase
MKTAIITPTYNRSLSVERLLSNLSQCDFPPDVEICVVENGSRDGTETVCDCNTVGGRVRYLHSRIPGRSVAVNFAIKKSAAEFFIFFDDDITVPPHMIKTYIDAAQRYGQGHFFGGPLVAETETSCPSHLLPYLPASAKGRSLASQETEIDTSQFNYFFGGNWGAFRADLFKVGLFDENLGAAPGKYSPAGDETELQQRLVAAGIRPIYLPGAVIHHFVGKECYTPEWVSNVHLRYGLTDFIIARKKGKKGREILGIPLRVTGELIKQKIKLTIARLLRFSIERRTELKIREAYLSGWLYGAWTWSRTRRRDRQELMR